MYLCQLVFAEILWVKLLEMFCHRVVTQIAYAFREGNDHVGIFLKLTGKNLRK